MYANVNEDIIQFNIALLTYLMTCSSQGEGVAERPLKRHCNLCTLCVAVDTGVTPLLGSLLFRYLRPVSGVSVVSCDVYKHNQLDNNLRKPYEIIITHKETL